MAKRKLEMHVAAFFFISLFSLGWFLIPETTLAQVFIAAKKSKYDYVGKGERLGRNGMNDVRLRFTLSEKGKTLTDIEIRDMDSRRSLWDTIPGNGVWLVAVAQKGRLLNRTNGDIRIGLKSSHEIFDLFIEDNGSIRKGRTRYKLTAFFSNGSRKESILGHVPYAETIKAQVYIADERSAVDFVGQGEPLRPNGNGDVHVRLVLGARGKTVSGFEIQNISGRFSLWDTFSGNNTWLIAVVKNGKILNRFNGEITIPLDLDREDFDLFLEDNGSVRAGLTHYKLTVFFSDESRREFTVGPIRDPESPWAQVQVFELKSSADYVGMDEVLQANGNGDVRMQLVIRARGKTLTGLDIKKGQQSVWDTTPGNGVPLIALFRKGRCLNSPGGEIGVYLGSGREVFDLFIEDDGSVYKGGTRYKLTTMFSDGTRSEAPVENRGAVR